MTKILIFIVFQLMACSLIIYLRIKREIYKTHELSKTVIIDIYKNLKEYL